MIFGVRRASPPKPGIASARSGCCRLVTCPDHEALLDLVGSEDPLTPMLQILLTIRFSQVRAPPERRPALNAGPSQARDLNLAMPTCSGPGCPRTDH